MLGWGDRGSNPAFPESSEPVRRNVPASWRINEDSRRVGILILAMLL